MKHQVKGSITVFLALAFLLILALIMTSLEAARTAALRVFAQLALSTAVESATADFYRPLFDEYGLYALDLGYGERVANIDGLSETVERYLTSNLEFGDVENLSVEITQMLTDDKGRVFMEQAVEAEQTVVAEQVVTALLEQFGLLADQSETLHVLERKTEVEEQLSLIDATTLNLMKLIDGVDFNRQLMFNGGKVYSIAKQFVKSFMIYDANSVNTAINNPELFAELAPYYRNPIDMAEELQSGIGELKRLIVEREQIVDITGDDNQDSDILSGYAADIVEQVKYCNMIATDLSVLFDNTLSLMEQAILQISAVDVLKTEIREKVLEYEELLRMFSQVADDDLVSDLVTSLNEMKSYVGLAGSNSVTDYAGIKATLEYDIALLSACIDDATMTFSESDSKETLEHILGRIESLKNQMSKFSYSELRFDYSGLKTKTVQDGIFNMVKSEINDSLAEKILEFMLSENVELSDLTVDTSLFPHVSKDTFNDDDKAEPLSSESMPDTGEGEILKDGEASLFDITSQSPLVALATVMTEGAETLYDKALMTLFADDRFANYPDGNKANDKVLNYEQEFLIAGHETDKENLASVLLQIVMIRLVPTAVFTYTNRDTVEQARSFADSTVGMIGMPFLTAVATALILLVWALEQAVVETAAVLRGYKVPPLTSDTTFCIDFAEIVAFSATFVGKKAETFKRSDWGLDYDAYLKMLLLVRSVPILSERSLGLIQENLRYAYDEDFMICNCVTGVCATAMVADDSTYLALFPGLIGRGPDRYGVTVQSHIVY